MGDRPKGLLIPQARQQTPEHRLKMAPFRLDRRLRRLRQHPAHIFVAFRRATAVVLFQRLSRPGQVPEEAKCPAEGNVLACTPTSAITCCAESAEAGPSASRTTAS